MRVLSILFSVSSLEGRNQLSSWQASSGELKQTAKRMRLVWSPRQWVSGVVGWQLLDSAGKGELRFYYQGKERKESEKEEPCSNEHVQKTDPARRYRWAAAV